MRKRNVIGRRDGRLAWSAATLLALAALAFPTLAAAEPATVDSVTAEPATSEEAAVLEPIATSPRQALAFWTRARRERAEPLPVVTLPGPPAEAPGEAVPESPPEELDPTPLAAGSLARTAAVDGVEVSATEAEAFPNSANGKVYGVFAFAPRPRIFECSGSVVAGSVVLTAGHCVIDPETGEHALAVVFAPAYNNGETAEPYGEWLAVATDYAFTKSWEQTAKPGSYANEGSDLAFLKMSGNLERAVGGSLAIAFDQPCNQTYTQYGYPGEGPYDGEVLYSHVAPYAGPDANRNFSPTPMKIASDFTKGASGGPWTVGPSTSPTVLSVTAYSYESQPGYLFGPYFGEAAREAYVLASGSKEWSSHRIEESCKPLEEIHPEAPPASTPVPPAASAPPTDPVTLRVTRIHRRANGSAVLTARVGTAGKLRLRGANVRTETVNTLGAGKYRLIVAPKGSTSRKLQRKGRVKVGVKVAFSAAGKTRRIKRSIRLARHRVERSNRHHHVRRPR